ncbi:aspartate 1-decarboxylase [bacterium]|nr:aspartate 1-decarboxylase [bacterium]
MWLRMCKSKIHRAKVTDADLNYEGSITIDSKLIKAAGLIPSEMVQVYNIATGVRIETYIIEGDAESGVICLNGAAARHFAPGDLVIIVAFALMTPEEAQSHQPRIVLVDDQNRIKN